MNALRASQFCYCRTFVKNYGIRWYATEGITSFADVELSAKVKHDIENHWRHKLPKNEFDASDPNSKYVVVPMFPYPSGSLHLGHVRVYAISDAMARFARLRGKNVLHPIGWDAFGLPAENAAIERNIPPDEWTKQNIAHMRKQLKRLGCSFDWSRELSTCDPKYYKWTQWIFLQMFKDGLAYQREAIVNWDPIDKTVLANEQVNADGCSWRSGAKVERKLLKQWFIRSTKFAKQLYDHLDNSAIEDWQKIQKNWIGEPNGYNFTLELYYVNDANENGVTQLKSLSIWTERPEELMHPGFIAIKSDHVLANGIGNFHLLDITARNPFNEGTTIPIIVCDDIEYQPHCDTYLGLPSINAGDKEIADQFWLKYNETEPSIKQRDSIIKKAKNKNIGGYLVSSRLQDWLISRQRYWGTPIPIVHCSKCGPVAVPESKLPITLPEMTADESGKPIPLSKRDDWLATTCPKCKNAEAKRESDTMDTFFDSSWYFLRYFDPKDDDKIFNKNLAKKVMPVDLYIGGIEHAVLHLYIARFVMQHFYAQGLVATGEPFKRLLVQGMVNGRTFLTKDGRYLNENDVSVLNEKQDRAEEIDTGLPVQIQWEKMSKSKRNGVDPLELFAEYSVDTIRLIVLANAAPRSPINWSKLTFPGILRFQHCLWLALMEFNKVRRDESISMPSDEKYKQAETHLFDWRNINILQTTHYYNVSQLNVVVKKLEALSDELRRTPRAVVKYSPEYETALAHLIIMLAPLVPLFASELWSKFVCVPNRCESSSDKKMTFDLSKDLLEQRWPTVSQTFDYWLDIKIDGKSNVSRIPRADIDALTREFAMERAKESNEFNKLSQASAIEHIGFRHLEGTWAMLNVETKRPNKKKKKKPADDDIEEEQCSEMS